MGLVTVVGLGSVRQMAWWRASPGAGLIGNGVPSWKSAPSNDEGSARERSDIAVTAVVKVIATVWSSRCDRLRHRCRSRRRGGALHESHLRSCIDNIVPGDRRDHFDPRVVVSMVMAWLVVVPILPAATHPRGVGEARPVRVGGVVITPAVPVCVTSCQCAALLTWIVSPAPARRWCRTPSAWCRW